MLKYLLQIKISIKFSEECNCKAMSIHAVKNFGEASLLI